ncbi:hypothetical protein MYP_2410 [Sporocytophaga myxococcoides]|uniref:Uncharacterized protein n=1 Tax=Sporocytophaga myxococcoides TaxID=153721 RepID=A0A098LDV1_9BACT|nr:hypothetical protein [Sporocytophaga myxococcoides]GAL85181.1 hypothetical protein MYP_2410 [Sporocytophaga myxococcoides]
MSNGARATPTIPPPTTTTNKNNNITEGLDLAQSIGILTVLKRLKNFVKMIFEKGTNIKFLFLFLNGG